MANTGGLLVLGLGICGLLTAACGSADLAPGDEEAGSIAQPVTFATLFDVSAAPVRTQVKVCRSGVGPSPRVVDCAVDPGYSLVGGGARALWTSSGAMLTQSEPLSDGFTWRARSVDHTFAEPHDLEVYAIGVRLDGVNARVLRGMMSTWGIAVASDGLSSSAPGRIVSGGGNVTGGKLLTLSHHDSLGWAVGGRAHLQTGFPGVSLGVRLIPSGIVEGFGAIDIFQQAGTPSVVSTGVGTSVATALTGWAVVGYGAEATTTSGPGRLLFGMGPDGTNVRRARAQSKDHVTVSGGSTTVYYTTMRRLPGSHGLCNTGDKLATSMDSCVASICGVDPYCCNTRWDGICVNRVQSTCGRSCTNHTCGTPVFNPTFWSSGPSKENNACYDYANNRLSTGIPAAPGQNGAVEVLHGNMTVATLTEAAAADGLIPISETGICPDGRTKIALAIKPMPNPPVLGQLDDYHWYRQDSNGRWSHKMGTSVPSDRDAAGQLITNPRLANRGAHTLFGGYFCTCSSATEGQGHALIGIP